MEFLLTIKNVFFCPVSLNIVIFIWKAAKEVDNFMAFGQVTPLYDNVSGTSKQELSQSGHQSFKVRYLRNDINNQMMCYIIYTTSFDYQACVGTNA